MIVSQKVVRSEFVISTEGRNLIFSRSYGFKISRSARNDKEGGLFTRPLSDEIGFDGPERTRSRSSDLSRNRPTFSGMGNERGDTSALIFRLTKAVHNGEDTLQPARMRRSWMVGSFFKPKHS